MSIALSQLFFNLSIPIYLLFFRANGTIQHLALLKLSVPLNETLAVQRISIAEPETSVGSGVFLGLTYLTNANISILNIYKSNVTDILSSKGKNQIQPSLKPVVHG